MRLRLVPETTNWNFFGRPTLWLGISVVMIVLALASFGLRGLNYGIDFQGGTTIRTESAEPVDVGAYRDALAELRLGDVVISEVYDPNFGPDQNVAMIRIQSQEGEESASAELIEQIEATLGELVGGTARVTLGGADAARVSTLDLPGGPQVEDLGDAVELVYQPALTAEDRAALVPLLRQSLSLQSLEIAYDDYQTASVESVGPKVSGELIQTAAIAVALAIATVLIYIWLRFEWQFALGAVVALIHDVVLTIGIFSEVGIRFDLSIIAALLTIVGYSLNDTVVVFDRVRENLIKYKSKDLKEVLNLSINETLSRTFMTSFTTLIALISLFVLGGDVIRGFVFAMIWGVVVGTYSSIFVASIILLKLGVKRDWTTPPGQQGNQFGNIDA